MRTHPDLVIARYMRAVQDIPADRRTTLDVDLSYPFRTWMWITMPVVIPVLVRLTVASWLIIAKATWTRNANDRLTYRLFFAGLEQRGWTLAGRAKVAGGLLLLRMRHEMPDTAIPMYDASSIGRIVRKEEIRLADAA